MFIIIVIFRADDEDDYVPDSRYNRGGGGTEKVVLPTAPRASLGPNISEDRIPRDPPFTAYIANLSYDIDLEDVHKFFERQNVTNIRLLRDGDPENGRLKGKESTKSESIGKFRSTVL